MKQKKIIIIAASAFLVLASALGVWKWHDYRKNTIRIRLPDGKIVTARRARPMKAAVRDAVLSAKLSGKIELVTDVESSKHPTTSVVMITNSGELIILINPPEVNRLRSFFVGKEVELSGSWHGQLPFHGRLYRSLWIENIKEFAPIPKKPVARVAARKKK